MSTPPDAPPPAHAAPRPDYDVVIVGGGAAGSVLALALAGLPLKVCLLEARPPIAVAGGTAVAGASPRSDAAANSDAAAQAATAVAGAGATRRPPGPPAAARCTALADASQRILATLGVWPGVRGGATPIREIHVSDRGHFGSTCLEARREGVAALGYVVENDPFVTVLWQQLQQRAAAPAATGVKATGVTCRAPARLVDASVTAEEARVQIVAGGENTARTLRCSLLVAADGGRSPLREHLGIDTRVHAYRQHAIVANVVPERFHEHRAFERFTDSGPLALLPLSGGRCNLVWSVWQDDAQALLQLDDAAFLAALQRAFGYRLGRLREVTPRRAFPLLRAQVPAQALPPRVALIGNAAISVHPVAGQGLNLGLRDAAALAEVLGDALAEGERDVGAARVLASFEQERAPDRRRVTLATDALVRLFTQPFLPVSVARSLGLIGLDLLPVAKSAFARAAMGYGGRVPRLARGVPLRVAPAAPGLAVAAPPSPMGPARPASPAEEEATS